jgi:hypothetical protein
MYANPENNPEQASFFPALSIFNPSYLICIITDSDHISCLFDGYLLREGCMPTQTSPGFCPDRGLSNIRRKRLCSLTEPKKRIWHDP